MPNATIKTRGATKFTSWSPSGAEPRGATVFTESQWDDNIDCNWDGILDQIQSFYSLVDDWDGNDSAAPSREFIGSAMRLAYSLKHCSHPAPDRVVAGVNGTVSFEYAGSPWLEIEVSSDDEARVYEHGRQSYLIAI